MKLSSSNMRPTADGWSLRQRSDLSSSASISAGRCSESIGQGKGYERVLCIYEDSYKDQRGEDAEAFVVCENLGGSCNRKSG